MPKKQPKNKKFNPALGVILLGILILVAAAVLFVTQQQPTPAPTPAAQADIPYPEIPRVTLADSKAALEQRTAIFVDVRSLDSYTISHIRGAISVPINEIGTRTAELPADQWIITYCT
ncbi:MAG: hypothetical protein CVU39_00845 [Chloroflexi bacterium HGW-Chloroflexi-10]|nr:MAG: hypothetical protein CVU39_00845 [Chloroflexi bacterium HGW-Chloroflexi-10]